MTFQKAGAVQILCGSLPENPKNPHLNNNLNPDHNDFVAYRAANSC